MLAAQGVYPALELPPAPEERPYVFLNMIATIDGKILSGERDEHVADLGSETDRATMAQIEAVADGVMAGAQSVRATPIYNLPEECHRYCISRSGDVPTASGFFADAPERSFLVMPSDTGEAPSGVQALRFGKGDVDLKALLQHLRTAHGLRHMLCEGGSELNAQLFEQDLVDEVFLTVAPKVRLGREVPTIAGGNPLARGAIQQYALVSCRPVADEVFLRYRRRRPS